MVFRLFAAAAALSFAASAANSGVTFSSDVAPILYSHCVSCHHANDIAPMSLVTYKEVRPWAAAIREAVQTRKMPPWKADPHYGKWSNDPTLSDAQIATIQRWAESGAPEGDPKALPPAPVFPDGWKIGKPDAVVTMPEQKLQASGPDEYAYVTVPTNFTEDKWVIAAELRPGNLKVVHHAHVFVLDPETKETAATGEKIRPPRTGSGCLSAKARLNTCGPTRLSSTTVVPLTTMEDSRGSSRTISGIC